MTRSSQAVLLCACVSTIAVLVGACGLSAQETPQRAMAGESHNDALPGVTINREQGFVDLDATVNLREGGWLELLACTPNTRTHESILVVHAKPSHIHLAVLALGLKPGAPMRWRQVGDSQEAQPAYGPAVAVSIVTQEQGRTVETPANQWVTDRQTDQAIEGSTWLFTGSSFDNTKDPPRYRADVEGSVLSLVNFGDEVFARPTDKTNQTDGASLWPNTEHIPPVGTKAKIRLRRADNNNAHTP